MNPGAPSLYLDPLLPLALHREPRSIPAVAGAVPARAILITASGGYRIAGNGVARPAEIRAPGLFWRRADEAVPVRTLAGDPEVPCTHAGWLLIVGQRLLDQLIVAAFGEPGFSRFLEALAGSGSSPSGPFLDDLDELLESLARELDERPPAWRVRARSILTKACALLRHTGLPVTQIAIDVGYNNVSFFNRYFRRIMRCSPREYRREVTE